MEGFHFETEMIERLTSKIKRIYIICWGCWRWRTDGRIRDDPLRNILYIFLARRGLRTTHIMFLWWGHCPSMFVNRRNCEFDSVGIIFVWLFRQNFEKFDSIGDFIWFYFSDIFWSSKQIINWVELDVYITLLGLLRRVSIDTLEGPHRISHRVRLRRRK